ncbi:MAG: adenylate kinase [Anaerolineae bacterium]|jgi:adenylate kinase|nr:adenylate kinase [Chloroflexota bacterium]
MVDIILLGGPGAGKGTQGELMETWLDLPRVSSGDLFRYNLSQQTELGQQAKGYMDRGELVPDEITIGMVAERIARPDCANGVVFDGFPRTVGQAAALDALLAGMGRAVNVVLNIAVSEDVLLQRLAGRWTCSSCGAIYHRLFSQEKVEGVCDACGGGLMQREDDNLATQQRRIRVYQEQTAPLDAYYRQRGVLVDIDGEQSPEQVGRLIRAAIEAVLP